MHALGAEPGNMDKEEYGVSSQQQGSHNHESVKRLWVPNNKLDPYPNIISHSIMLERSLEVRLR